VESSKSLKLVAGLGNPGRKYHGTRHNVGFLVIEELARKYATARPRSAFEGEIVEADLAGCRSLLLCPHTFMNRSGESVAKALEFYKLPITDLLVVCDDFHLPVAKLRCRAKGSSGGQKGLGDILSRLRTEEIARLRIGVGEPPEGWNPADYVLGKFAKQELPEIEESVWRAADAVVLWARDGIRACMNKVN
jgi:peptidyl-tRNA hydrolase, PTH1 family